MYKRSILVHNPPKHSIKHFHDLASSLGNCAGTKTFGLFYQDKLIGVAKFGLPTNRYDKDCLELRRFFILDGTPRNTESFFLRNCEKQLSGNLVTYIHSNERGCYLKALNWKQLPIKTKTYDGYLINNTIISKRKMWGWAKKVGLIEKFGTTVGKELLGKLLGATKIVELSKIKFIKKLD